MTGNNCIGTFVKIGLIPKHIIDTGYFRYASQTPAPKEFAFRNSPDH
jgi:hypothetical protein